MTLRPVFLALVFDVCTESSTVSHMCKSEVDNQLIPIAKPKSSKLNKKSDRRHGGTFTRQVLGFSCSLSVSQSVVLARGDTWTLESTRSLLDFRHLRPALDNMSE